MSYDVFLRPGPACQHCGRQDSSVAGPDPTYNLTPIFHLALTGEDQPSPEVSEAEVVLTGAEVASRGLRVLDGKKASETIGTLEAAVKRLVDPALRERFLELEPTNRWGDLAGALSVMRQYFQLAQRYPDHTWEVH